MSIECSLCNIGDNNFIVGGDYIINYKNLSKEDFKKIFDKCCNNYYNRKLRTYKEKLYNLSSSALVCYDWDLDEEQHLFMVLGDTSEYLAQRIEYYRVAIEIKPDSEISNIIKKIYIRCKIIKFIKEFFQSFSN